MDNLQFGADVTTQCGSHEGHCNYILPKDSVSAQAAAHAIPSNKHDFMLTLQSINYMDSECIDSIHSLSM